MHRVLMPWIVGLVVMVVLPCAASACTLNIDTVGSIAWTGGGANGYDPFDTTAYFQPINLRVTSTDGDCAFYATVTPTGSTGGDGSLSGPGGSLRFAIYRDATGSQLLQSAPIAVQAEVLSGAAKQAGPATAFQIAYSLPIQQIVAPGPYSGQITVAVYEGAVGSGILRAQHQVPITILVASIAEISFAAGSFNKLKSDCFLAFNILHQGDRKEVEMWVRSNSGYRIAIHSDGGGAMTPLHSAPAEAMVPYSLKVDGVPVALAKTDVQVIIHPGPTPWGGNRHLFTFEIGTLKDACAGDYQDILPISVTSLN